MLFKTNAPIRLVGIGVLTFSNLIATSTPAEAFSWGRVREEEAPIRARVAQSFALRGSAAGPVAAPAPVQHPERVTERPSISLKGFPADGLFFTEERALLEGTAHGAERVEVWADQRWQIASVPVGADGSFKVSHRFTTAAAARHLSIRSYQGTQRVAEWDNRFEVVTGAPIAVNNLRDGSALRAGGPIRLQGRALRAQRIVIALDGQPIAESALTSEAFNVTANLPAGREGPGRLTLTAQRASGEEFTREFAVRLDAKAEPADDGKYFNSYLLRAAKKIAENYGLLGYNITKQFTHPISFHDVGVFKPTGGGKTMCVSAMLEVIVTALNMYAIETGDVSVYSFLPFRSWSNLGANDLKAHIWVSSSLGSWGTADALKKFGMGETVPFKELRPGSFINLNRTNRTGHAVLFVSYLDRSGNELDEWSDKVVGFKYFSAQGKSQRGAGGMSYKYAFFSDAGCPSVPFPRDCGVIRSDSQKLLTTGVMWNPSYWIRTKSIDVAHSADPNAPDVVSAPGFAFDGLTTDD